MPAAKWRNPRRRRRPGGRRTHGPAGQTGTPLHKLGTDAVAVVDQATGTTAVRPMDYVFAKQSINLGPKGAVTLSFLSGCMSEVIQAAWSRSSRPAAVVAGGKLVTKAARLPHRQADHPGQRLGRRDRQPDHAIHRRQLGRARAQVRAAGVQVGQEPGRRHHPGKGHEKDGQVIWETAASQDWVAYPAGQAKAARLAVQGGGLGRRPDGWPARCSRSIRRWMRPTAWPTVLSRFPPL